MIKHASDFISLPAFHWPEMSHMTIYSHKKELKDSLDLILAGKVNDIHTSQMASAFYQT